MAKKSGSKTVYCAWLVRSPCSKPGLVQVWPKSVDVKAIRKGLNLSQSEFAEAFAISKRAVQEWEQGGRQPDSAARAYLKVIAREPDMVRRALAD